MYKIHRDNMFLSLKDKIIIMIEQCGDIHPFNSGPIFKGAEKILLLNCDKNFVFYWLNKRTFPNVKKHLFIESSM